MNYLIDASTLASASKGSRGLSNYLREAGTWGIEGLTQLLDTARLINLIVTSDEIITACRNIDMPRLQGISRDVDFLLRPISLETDPQYWQNISFQSSEIQAAKKLTAEIESLLGNEIIIDFTYEIEFQIDESDRNYVNRLSHMLLNKSPNPAASSKQESDVFGALMARTFQYMQTADKHSLSYVCHAYRAPIVKLFHPNLTVADQNLFIEFERNIRRWLVNMFRENRVEFSLPMFFLAILRDAKTPEDLFRLAIQYRDSNEVIEIRRLFSEIVNETGCLNLREYGLIQRAINDEGKRFCQHFGLSDNLDAQSSVEISFSLSSIAEVNINVPKLYKELIERIKSVNERRTVALIFKLARNTFDILSFENDVHRLWNVRLNDRHKSMLKQILDFFDK